MVAIWWGAATSKLNRHFPFVVAAMESNSPVWRAKRIKRLFHRDFPEDLRPSRLSATLAHAGTVVEFGVPLLLLLGDGGVVTKVARRRDGRCSTSTSCPACRWACRWSGTSS